jgi:hypothetical protein
VTNATIYALLRHGRSVASHRSYYFQKDKVILCPLKKPDANFLNKETECWAICIRNTVRDTDDERSPVLFQLCHGGRSPSVAI